MSIPEPPETAAQEQQIADLREQLATFGPLFALLVLMTTSFDEAGILAVATSAAPSLAPCQVEGVHLDGGWLTEPSLRRSDVARLETQLAELSGHDGQVDVGIGRRGWAFPLVSPGDVPGYVVVSSAAALEDHQRFMLAVLLQHAGMAIANARLHARQRALSEQLHRTNFSLERAASDAEEARAAAQRSVDIHRQLTAVAAAAEGVTGIARAVRRLSGRSVAVEDRHGNLLAWAGPGQPVPYSKSTPAARQRLLRRVAETGRPLRHRDRLIWVARSGDEVFGVVALIEPAEEANVSDEVVLEHASTVLMLELSRLRAVAETELRLRRDLVEELLSGAYLPALQDRATALGYDLARTRRVAVLSAEPRRADPEALFHAARRSVPPGHGPALLAMRPSGVALLCAGEEDWDQVRQAVEAELGRGSSCRMGVGAECTDHSGLPRSLEEAELALKLQVAGGAPASVTHFDQLGIYRLLGYMTDLGPVNEFVRQWLGPLMAHDRARDGELLATLSAYLEAGGNYDRAATALSVHRSTLRYRLNRIRELSGLDLSDANTRFNAQLATRAWYTMTLLRPSLKQG